MATLETTKDRAIYHAILGDMHRVQSMTLNMASLDDPDTRASLAEHFARERTIALSRLGEWRQRRPDIYRAAEEDFKLQAAPKGE